jgi:hypothetical protein
MKLINNLSSSVKSAFSRNKRKEHAKSDRKIIEQQSQKEIDKTISDSFPASDPPGNY